MGDPQDPLGAFQVANMVLTWRSPPDMRATVRTTLCQSPLAQGVPSARLAVIEGMVYGCRVAEVLTFCLTAGTLDGLCRAFMEERDHVTGMYEEEQRLERLRLEQAVAAAQPVPPAAASPAAAPPAAAAPGPAGPVAAAAGGVPQGPLHSGPRGGGGAPPRWPAPRGGGRGGRPLGASGKRLSPSGPGWSCWARGSAFSGAPARSAAAAAGSAVRGVAPLGWAAQPARGEARASRGPVG